MFRFRLLPAAIGFLILWAAGVDAGDPDESKRTGTRSPYRIQSSVLGAAGRATSGSGYEQNGTLGQPTPVGEGASSDLILHAGFWWKYSIWTSVLDGVVPPVFRNRLFPNAPNPFNPSTTIRYEVGETSPVSMVIYNIRGRRLKTLVNGEKPPGRYEIVWDGRNDRGEPAASGVYLCRLQVGKYGSVKKMVLVK